MSLEPAPYLGAFKMLSDDFRRLAEYVEPADQNLSTYSHRLYELLLMRRSLALHAAARAAA